ncbi:hypothetical protein AB0C90_19880 [Streptomyces sp. NPDC048550]|uniref:hypothetical protein n=1 Tax=unclassified Streptomyces TaxID=2593676 RepID=UPI002E1363C7|nr:hypothetical protein OG299_10345 [Streptomyces sp. NBC_01296]WSW62529.1 hypothetical protein OG513_30300 [Streptomyces sp. NBC_00998]
MKPISRAVRAVVSSSRTDGQAHPHHPAEYGITDPEQVRELLATWPDDTGAADHFACMCLGHEGRVTLYEASGQLVRTVHVSPSEPMAHLLDPADADGIPGRHRTGWAQAAPAGLREYAGAMALGSAPDNRPAVPLSVVFGWLGTPLPHEADAASVLAVEAPMRLLADEPTDELAWAVRESGRVGLEGAVRFFASEEFTTRHPKRRRVPDTARNLLLAHARSHRPTDLPVLERRLLRTPDDRVRRS